MWVSRRLLNLLGMGTAAAFAAIVLPASAAHAADGDSGPFPGWGGGPYETCNGAVCLVMEPLTRDSIENDWTYSGVRPFVTDWKGDQLYNVQYTGEDGQAIDAGSYNINIDDFWSLLFSSSAYQFGDFVSSADAPNGTDLGWYGDLAGSSISKVDVLDGAFTNLTINNVGPHDASYWVMSTPGLSYTQVSVDGVSAAYLQLGESDPFFLWNSLPHSGLLEAQVPDYLIPNDPFAELDFDPSQYFPAA